jgi:hypothetical protein
VVTIIAEAAFEQELEIFRKEEETAQQHFFAYLSVREHAASDIEGSQGNEHGATILADDSSCHARVGLHRARSHL